MPVAVRSALAALLALVLVPAIASAQDPTSADPGQGDAAGPETSAEETSVPSRAAAAEAYDRGSAFYLNEDWRAAARWFETAYRLSPAAPALLQAIRAHLRAEHFIRAANLALRLEALHGENPEAAALARSVLAEHGASFFRLDVDCDACTVEIDGRISAHPSAMLAPSTEHRVVVTLEGAAQMHRVRGDAGTRQTLGPPDGSAPAPSTAAPGDEASGPADTPASEPVEELPRARRGASAEPAPRDAGPSPSALPVWVFGVGVGLTAVSTAILVWSGVDTLDGVEAFEARPTRAAFDEGEGKEARTNVMLGVTLALGAASLVAALFTDFGSGAPLVGAWVSPEAGGVSLRARF